MKIQNLDHIALTVRDTEASAVWYESVLGLERRFEEVWNPPVTLCVGDTCLALFPASSASPAPAPDSRDTLTMRHFAFRLSRLDFEQAQTELQRRGIDFTFDDHTISHSIYLTDPDGYRIELTTYELG